MRKMYVGVLASFLVAVVTASAQMGGPGSNPAQSAMEKISKLFEKQSFSARVVMTMPKAEKTGPMEFTMMMSKGKTRMEMDMAKMVGAAGKDAQMPAGMSKMVMITRVDKKVMYHVMPGLKAYAEIAFPDKATEKADSVKVERKVEGQEKVEGYDCEKVRNTVTVPDGKPQVVMTWEANELKGLPVKVEVETPEGKMTMLYKDIKTDKLADSLFDPPAGYTKYGSMQDMMMKGMMNMVEQPE